jgi:hypothetical protein
MRFSTIKLVSLASIAILFLFAAKTFGQAKLKPEEILAKHIGSIGTPESTAAAINRKIEGTALARNVRVTRSTVNGSAFLASTSHKHLLLMAFEAANSGDYTGERIIYDGKKITIPFVTAAERSPVGTFIFEYPEIAKGYIFGGALFASWALLDAANKVGKFELQGKEKIDGVEVYKMKFTPKGGTSLNIRMFFDATNFRHVRTEYQRTETAGTIRVDEGRVNENRYKLIEDFSDFGEVNGMTLPRNYKVTFRFETIQRSAEFEWVIKLTRFGFDPKAPPEVFIEGRMP